MSELSNYTCYDNKDDKYQGGSDLASNPWYSEEIQAWVCNQRNDCKGFVFAKDSGHGGWFKKTNAEDVPSKSDNRRRTCVKKDYNWRKADNPDTSNLSILSRDQTKTRFIAWGTSWTPAGDTIVNTGTTCCGQPGYPSCNGMNQYRVPLGWKWMMTDNGILNGNNVEGYWDRNNMGWDGTKYDLDRPNNHGMTDRDDCILAQNIGFDIPANWDTMVSKGVHPDDALQIKHNWCNANTDNINTAKCTNFYATPEAAAAGFHYDQDLFYMCKNDPQWFQKSACRTAINNGVKGTNESVRQQSKDLVKGYCNTPDGENQSDGICGCANVVKYAGRCLTDKAGIPGCKELKSTVGDLPPSAQVAFSDMFCASDVCVTQALGDAALLPSYTQGKQCPNITQCIQDFRNANFQGSQIDASCKNTVNITGVAAPAPAAGPAPAASTPAASTPAASTPTASTPAASTPAAAPAAGPTITNATPSSNTPIPAGKFAFVDQYAPTPQKQYALIGCIIIIILCCLFMMFSGGQKQGIDPMMLAMMAR